ncbi:MAG: hypothetical protein EA366_12800 [Spirulina sp. DLM2.Bin59]|nr:MAG: hypothetical protein EA366_12800 [Spirulina sp. DLM2.Bin59]
MFGPSRLAIAVFPLLLGACTQLPTTIARDNHATTPESAPMAMAQAPITPEHLSELRQAGIPIVLPRTPPAGFQVDGVQVEQKDYGSGYLVTYRQTSGSVCFDVEATNMGGFGGPLPEQIQSIDPPPIAQSSEDEYFLHWTETGEGDGPFPEPTLFSDWIEGRDGVYYRLSSRQHTQNCDLLKPETAIEILSSLAYLD